MGEIERERVFAAGHELINAWRSACQSHRSERRDVPEAVIPATVFGQYLMIEFKPFKLLDRPGHR